MKNNIKEEKFNLNYIHNKFKIRLAQIEIEKAILDEEIIMIEKKWKELERLENETNTK